MKLLITATLALAATFSTLSAKEEDGGCSGCKKKGTSTLSVFASDDDGTCKDGGCKGGGCKKKDA